MTSLHQPWHGAGLGLRRELIPALRDALAHERTNGALDGLSFVELAPENWAGEGGPQARFVQALSERLPIVAHGLCLNLGGYAPLDMNLLADVKALMKRLRMPFYSEHLAWTADDGNLYDLMPLPFNAEAVRHVAARIRQVQDALECHIGIENVSTYVGSPLDEMSEVEFLQAVLAEADCALHLDVNNVYVNSVNHGFDARDYIAALPADRLAYIHVAGHLKERADLLIDTHGADVIDPVWALLDHAYACHGVRPTLLERDFNIPPLPKLMREVRQIGSAQARAGQPQTSVEVRDAAIV